MEDELMRLFGSDKLSVMMQKFGLKYGEAIEHPWISKAVENAQRKVEGMNFDIRKQLIEYDNVMNKQREAVYKLRDKVLEGEDVSETIKSMIKDSVEEKLKSCCVGKYAQEWDFTSINLWLKRSFNIEYEMETEGKADFLTKEALQENIYEKILKCYEKRKEEPTPGLFSDIERMILLQMIDSSWKDHLYELDQLRRSVGFRAYAQKDPKVEYQKESYILFESMMNRIRENTIEYIFKVEMNPTKTEGGNSEDSAEANSQLKNKVNNKVGVKSKNIHKIGRNDKCPCGSGKKYKKCCGRT
jgi:preprotein translocase subunit SecA